VKLCNELLSQKKDNTALFKKLIAMEDAFLDHNDDMADVLAFFKNQRAIFDSASALLGKLSSEQDYLQAEREATSAISQIKAILNMPKPYKKISELPNLIHTVETAYSQLLELKKQDVYAEIEAAMGEIHQTANLDQKNTVIKADNALDAKKKAAAEATTLTQLDAMKIQIASIRQQYIKALMVPVEKNVDIVSTNRSSVCYTAKLKSEADIDQYVAEIKEKRTVFCQTALLILHCLLVMFFLPARAEAPGGDATTVPISMSFEDYLARKEETWFLTGKKEYSVQAMMVSKEICFHNELEVTDYTVTDDGVTVILKGCFGEMWTTKLSKVISTYTKPDSSALCDADFAEKDSWIDMITKPEPDAYYAMYVPLNFSVTVETAWGNVLHTNLPNAPHGNGDFLVCRAGKDGKPDLFDVWILNGVVFPAYYDTRHCLIKPESDGM